MPSSGVSDGVQSKIISMYPDLNFLSIETSGDNEVNILSRVSMLLFKAKQKARAREAQVRMHTHG
jgi:predicted nucleotide-binding protein (sugar kinase/HSP70/actin superfamily)